MFWPGLAVAAHATLQATLQAETLELVKEAVETGLAAKLPVSEAFDVFFLAKSVLELRSAGFDAFATAEALTAELSRWGEVVHARLVSQRTSSSMFGFVEMATSAAAVAAVGAYRAGEYVPFNQEKVKLGYGKMGKIGTRETAGRPSLSSRSSPSCRIRV